MKRIIVLLLSLMLAAGLTVPVFADLIWIPEDPFLHAHMSECTRTDRSFRALTDTPIYESPESNKVLMTLAEGEAIWIYYTYVDADGNHWGNCEDTTDWITGWIPLAYTELVYDHISFEEDYGHLFTQESGTLDEAYVGQTIYFWNYPGDESGTQVPVEVYPPDYWHTYTDEEGRVWGYTGYYMGWKGYWFCIDDPTADFDTLFPEAAPEVEITEPDETAPTLPAGQIVPKPSADAMVLRIGVGAAVIGCVGLTALTLMKKRKNG